MSTYMTIALSAFFATLIRAWSGQKNKGPLNALAYMWARRVFFLNAAVIVVTTIWLAGAFAEWWIWPMTLD